MNRKPRSYVGLFQVFVALGILALSTCQGFAGVSSIYKWKDDQGKVHFTDDPLKIPLHYRSGPGLEKIRALPPPKSSHGKSSNSENAGSEGDSSEDQKNQGKSAVDPNAEKKKKARTIMRDALNFLKSDIQRFKKYEEFVPEHRHAVLLRDDIVNALPAKEGLAKQLEKSDSALLKQVRSYLKASLQRDYETKKRERSRGMIFISERSRINEEQLIKNSLIKKLTAKLASDPKKNPAQSKLPKPAEPAENNKKEDVTTALPQEEDPTTALPQKEDPTTTLPQEEDATTTLPQEEDATTALPQKEDSKTTLPQKDRISSKDFHLNAVASMTVARCKNSFSATC